MTARERDRLAAYAEGVDLGPAIAELRTARQQVLDAWLAAVRAQPFHLGRPARAVSDHIPPLFDAVIDAMVRASIDQAVPDDDRIAEAAEQHAQARVAQGLLPAEIVVEFRVLREEMLHALASNLRAEAAALVAAQMLIGAALDGAIGVAVDWFMQALERAKDDFVAVAAHDLRNPLTPLKAAAQLVQRQLASSRPDPVALTRNTTIIVQAVERMEQLINNLLDVTRVQTGRLETQPGPCDLYAVVNRVVARQSEEARERTVVVAPQEPLVGIWEESRIEQVVENLLSNALKYAPEGPISIRVWRRGDSAHLEVQDQGIGLTAEDRAQLFRRFYRSPAVIDLKLDGTGLGLFICRGIIEAHGGELEAYSAGTNKGTTMTVTLPLEGHPQ
ncbi:MAG TPA: sensor histidine kinase, partial [Dehalococcoidia bacterium]|nr:sensor histidine kinase [Dehalococcoidia bacterium]